MISDAQARVAIEVVRRALAEKGGMLRLAAQKLERPTQETLDVVKRAVEAALSAPVAESTASALGATPAPTPNPTKNGGGQWI